MARKTAKKTAKKKSYKSAPRRTKPFRLETATGVTREAESHVHLLGKGLICDTGDRGHESPRGRSPLEIVVDASEGFIPLWAKNTTLRWRFQARSLQWLANPEAAKTYIRTLMGEALLEWGDAAPVKFAENNDSWDFEIVVRSAANCNPSGCVLASAFFPDAGRHELILYPTMFEQSRNEQVETMIHEIGHVFGLRHFFANVSETAWPSEIFGTHSKFSIMNYGSLSTLTDADRSDLKELYQAAWCGELTEINGTPIQFVEPFHTLAPPTPNIFAPAAAATPPAAAGRATRSRSRRGSKPGR